MTELPLSVTPLYAGLLALIYVGLAVRVVRARRASGIGLGAGEDAVLLSRIRAHGNFAEYAPYCLLLLAILELAGEASMVLHVGGLALVVSRLAHAWGLATSSGTSIGRYVGMIGTFAILISGGIRALAIGLGL